MSIASHDTDLTRIADAVAGRRSGLERLGDFVALMKPRVMSLVVFTALVGLFAAPGPHDPIVSLVALLCSTAGACAAGARNMWCDADIDGLMSRTAMRPIPRGRVSRPEALAFGLMLTVGSVLTTSFVVNVAAAALLAFTIFFYVVVYTLKRRSSLNIVIGGTAGAFPPVIGWVATTGGVGTEPLILFLIVFLWTPPHFWALSLNRSHDYARAGIPMLPVVAGTAETKRQICYYSLLLAPVSILPWALGPAGLIYVTTSALSSATMIMLASNLRRSGEADKRSARRLFIFSIVYLFALFAALLLDSMTTQA